MSKNCLKCKKISGKFGEKRQKFALNLKKFGDKCQKFLTKFQKIVNNVKNSLYILGHWEKNVKKFGKMVKNSFRM